MKATRVFGILAAAALLVSCASPKSITSSMNHKNAEKRSKTEAKKFTKEGFVIFAGATPLEFQIRDSWAKTYETDQNGLPEYVITVSQAVGSNISAAKMQATHLAKFEIANLITSNIASLTESSVANKELTRDQAVSINNFVTATKELTVAELGRTFNVMEMYRELPSGNVEVVVRLAYSSKMAAEAAKKAIREKLETQSEELQKKLDGLLGWDKMFGGGSCSNTNMNLDE